MQKSALQILPIVSMPLFAENTFLVYQQGNSEAIVVDPGLEPDAILRQLKKRNLSVAAILNTMGMHSYRWQCSYEGIVSRSARLADDWFRRCCYAH